MDLDNDDPFAEDTPPARKFPPTPPIEAYHDELNREDGDEEPNYVPLMDANAVNTNPLPDWYLKASAAIMNGEDDDDFPDEFRNPTDYPDQSRYSRKNTINLDDPVEEEPETAPIPPKPTEELPSRDINPDDYVFCAQRTKSVLRIISTTSEAGGMTFDNFKKLLPGDSKERSVKAEIWLQNCIKVEDAVLSPGKDRPIFRVNRRNYINLYHPPEHNVAGGEVDTWRDFMDHLIPDEISRIWFEQWLAYKYTHPENTGVGVVMVANQQAGTGRGTLIKIFQKLFGQSYIRALDYKDFTGQNYQSQYNSYVSEALIACVEEAQNGNSGKWQTGTEFYERLKTLIDPMPGRQVKINRKGISNEMMTTFCSYFIATNHSDALRIAKEDRRLTVIENGDPMSEEFSDQIHEWLDNPANISALARYLAKVDMTDFNPFRPIMTDAKRDMIEASQSDMDRAIRYAIDNVEGECFTADQIIMHVNLIKNKHDWYLIAAWENIARKSIIPKVAFRIGTRDKINWQIKVDGKKIAVYAKNKASQAKWKSRSGLSDEVKKSDYLPQDLET